MLLYGIWNSKRSCSSAASLWYLKHFFTKAPAPAPFLSIKTAGHTVTLPLPHTNLFLPSFLSGQQFFVHIRNETALILVNFPEQQRHIPISDIHIFLIILTIFQVLSISSSRQNKIYLSIGLIGLKNVTYLFHKSNSSVKLLFPYPVIGKTDNCVCPISYCTRPLEGRVQVTLCVTVTLRADNQKSRPILLLTKYGNRCIVTHRIWAAN